MHLVLGSRSERGGARRAPTKRVDFKNHPTRFICLGCCGAIKENACMLGTYFVIILILFISLVVAAVVGYNKKFDTVPKPLKETMKKYKQGSKTMKAWDKIQKDVSCISKRLPSLRRGAYPK